jgi:ubiquitin-like modifier-activating enzyme ATG7
VPPLTGQNAGDRMPTLQFAPHTSLVQPAFWHELTRLKIDVLKLSQDSVPVVASYGPGRSITDRETGKDIALNGSLSVAGEGFDQDARCLPSLSAESYIN